MNRTRFRIVLRARGSRGLWTYSGVRTGRETTTRITVWPTLRGATHGSRTFANKAIAMTLARRLALELPGYAIAVVPANALPAAVLDAWPGAKVNPSRRSGGHLWGGSSVAGGNRAALSALAKREGWPTIREPVKPKKNPIAPDRAALDAAAKLRRDFTGHDATHVTHRKIKAPRVGLTVGPVLGILYATTRDGKKEKYLHRFRKTSRPLLAASHDGKTLVLVGGRYQFTDRGIVDT